MVRSMGNGTSSVLRRKFAGVYALTQDRENAEKQAGFKPGSGYAILRRPEIKELIAAEHGRLFEHGMPLAVDTVLAVMADENAPALARLKAAGMVLDRVEMPDISEQAKDPMSMTAEELSQAVTAAERRVEALKIVASSQAVDITPDEGLGIFD